jgi:AraC family transcriptional regulator
MNTHTQRDYEQRILRVLIHIQEHLDDSLDLEVLAEVACFSPYHFHRIFRGMVGESVKEYVRRLRIERAAHRLKSSELPVTQLAFEAGYETHAAFSRAFRDRFGESPTKFRELARRPGKPAPRGDGQPISNGLPTRPVLNIESAPMYVRFVDRVDVRVAFVRHVGPYSDVRPAWERLMEWANEHKLGGIQTEYIGLSRDDPDVTRPDKLRFDACMVVPPHIQAEGDIGIQTIAGGPYAIAAHHGPGENLPETYAALLGRYLPAHNRRPRSAPCFEVHHTSPATTPPDRLHTDVCVPLEA